MTQEELDINLIKQVIDTSLFDGIEYFHTYKGIKYYRCFCSTASGHIGLPYLAYIKNGKVEFVEDSLETRKINGDKLTHSH